MVLPNLSYPVKHLSNYLKEAMGLCRTKETPKDIKMERERYPCK